MVKLLVEGGGSVRAFIELCVERAREKLIESIKDTPVRSNLLRLIEGLGKAYEQSKSSAVTQLPLEIFVIEQGKNGGEKPVEKTKVQVTQTGKFKLEDVMGKWPEIMKQVKPKNHSIEALLRSTRPVGFDGERLELEVFYKFHKDKLESEKCRQIVEGAVNTVMGVNEVKLYLKLGEKREKPEEITGVVDDDIVRAAEEIFKVEAI